MDVIDLAPQTEQRTDALTGDRPECRVESFFESVRINLTSARRELDDFEPEGSAAVSLLSSVVEIVKVATSLKLSLVASVSASGAHREAGHRNEASLLAGLEGIPVGAAGATVTTANRLKRCPAAEDAMRKGMLSEAQARLVTAAAILAPEREADLVESAANKSVTELSDDCRRVRAAMSKKDPMETYRRIHEARSLRHWTDEEGAMCLQGRFTPDVGAKVIASIEAVADELFETARAAGSQEPLQAYRADALAGLVCGEREPVHAGVDIHVRVDHEALLRGHTVDGECSEIDGTGPLPIPKVLDLMTDAGVKVIFSHAEEISRIYHFTRTINATLMTALIQRDPYCVVPGCGATRFLEIDHVIPYGDGGPTSLGNLARLCTFHHAQKSNEAYRLWRSQDGTWHFDPPPPFGEEPPPGRPPPD
jgi:hypothetical protein